MILGVDTDVLVSWTMAGSPRHAAVRQFVEREVREEGRFLGVTPQVLHEFLHVVTDPKRFENPFANAAGPAACTEFVGLGGDRPDPSER